RASIVVVGLGAEGALLGVREEGRIVRQPALFTRPVVNTIGAGDALFSAFIHAYSQGGDPYQALYRASLFASYKIGETGAAEGFLTGAQLDDLCASARAEAGPKDTP
ncbi:MAG TPA: carbohydrate kinase family protein, partial [Anaerolineales bacterium]